MLNETPLLIYYFYKGGLDTNFRSLKANLSLSVAVAITGIGFPMALSFALQSLVGATPIQAFAAGAALCSTSLGTTFTILNASGLSTTRLGTVLTSAAMMDDVVGLVMVQVISNIGETAGSFSAVTVVRPLAVSFGLAIAVPLACRAVAQPLTVWLNGARKSSPNGALNKLCGATYTGFIIHTLVLAALVTGATYAGTSNLFAAYLAGASVSWWDSEVPHLDSTTKSSSTEPPSSPVEHGMSDNSSGSPRPSSRNEVGPSTEGEASERETILKEQSDPIASSGIAVYHRYYATPVQRILQPFFFVGHFPILPHSPKLNRTNGLDWVRHSYYRHVQRLSRLARNRLYDPHALREARHGFVARSPGYFFDDGYPQERALFHIWA